MVKPPEQSGQQPEVLTGQKTARGLSRFFSLKWKIIILLSLVLGMIHTSLVYYNYQSLRRDFESNVETNLHRYRDTLQQSLHRSGQRLQQIAGLLPGLVEVTARDGASADVWMSVQFELGLDLLAIYDESGTRLAGSVRSLGTGDRVPDILLQEIQEAALGERPESFILCLDTCMQYALVPFLSASGQGNVIALASILSDVVLDFPRLTGADMALMVQSTTPTHWDMKPVAISRAPINRPLLDELSTTVSLAELLDGYNFIRSGNTYRVQSLPLTDFNSRSDGRVLIYSDITQDLQAIQKGVLQEFIVGMLSLSIALLLVLWSLWGIIRRVTQLASAMPYLAVSAFDQARKIIGYESANPKQTRDEMDSLEDAALNLTDQLESLEAEVAERAESLQKERDFSQQLLDTAPVIIMTQTINGHVVHINQFGEDLLGWKSSELKDEPSSKLLADESEAERLYDQLKEFTRSGDGLLEQSTKARSRQGELREITWLHSIIDAQPRRMILSVGLDVTERTEAEDRMRWLAEHDPLTELFNRRKLNQEFERSVHFSEVNDYTAALLYIDMDGFNEINELCGHEIADDILRDVGTVLKANSNEG